MASIEAMGRLRGICLFLCVLIVSARAEVRVFVEETDGVAWLKYECTAGEVVSAFALDVRVNRGRIVGISNFFRGPCTLEAQGYGIFPAAFRDHVWSGSSSNVNWDHPDYTPVEPASSYPDDTLPGIGSNGVTLVFGALWDAKLPATAPTATGTLCSIHISEPATVTVAANLSRGGIVLNKPDIAVNTTLCSAMVGPAITNVALADGVITIYFKGGELLTAPAPDGPWTGTGNFSGVYRESVVGKKARFFRVREGFAEPAIISIALVDGVITIRFTGGELLAAPSPTGPWTATGNTSGVHTEAVSECAARFFRVRRL